MANVALRAIERTRAKARAIARLASQPPHARGGSARRGAAREGERGSRATPGERSTRDSGGSSKLPAWARVHHVCETHSGEQTRLLPKTPAMGVRAAVSEILARGADARGAATRRENREDARAVPKPEPNETLGAADRSKVRAKVIASPTPRRALGDASNRRSMFSPVSPGAGSPAPARSRRAGARR